MARRHTQVVQDEHIDTQGSDEQRTIFLVGDINEELTRCTIERLFTLAENRPKKPIYVVISSYGGSIHDAFCIYDAMKCITSPIRTVGLGKIMSAGVLLLAAGEKGKRRLGRRAQIMYHAGWSESVGTAFEMKSYIKQFEREEKLYDECMAYETGQTLETIRSLYICDDGNGKITTMPDRFIGPDEALRLGIIDEIVG